MTSRAMIFSPCPEEFTAYDPALNELISRVFITHRIPMDVFHGKRIRPVECLPAK